MRQNQEFSRGKDSLKMLERFMYFLMSTMQQNGLTAP